MGLACCAAAVVETPRGSLLELHSCELYAGGCTVSSESPQGGRQMLRVWDFTGGGFDGAELKGLKFAVLQNSADNLASPESQSGEAVIYLPQAATPAQRDALVAWLKSSQKDFHPATIQTRVAPLKFTKTEKGYTFTAADFVSVNVVSLESCSFGSCGEELWYRPRTATSFFTVAVNTRSQVEEPLLQLKWSDVGRRSVFLARFGETPAPRNIYVTSGELCKSSKSLF